jgi:hypothetical protein
MAKITAALFIAILFGCTLGASILNSHNILSGNIPEEGSGSSMGFISSDGGSIGGRDRENNNIVGESIYGHDTVLRASASSSDLLRQISGEQEENVIISETGLNSFPLMHVGDDDFGVKFAAKNLSILMITIGSRGDVQYWIPICARLIRLGHRCTLGTHERYRKWINDLNFGIKFVPIAGDPAKLMVRIMI